MTTSPTIRRLRRALPVPAAASLLLAASAAPMRAQTGEEVMRTLLERYEERMGDVRDYTVVQEVMGFESSTYFERTEVDGHTVFVPRTETGSEAARRAPESPYAGMFRLAERSRHEGYREVSGERCHVVAVTDFEGTDLFGEGGTTGMEDFRPERAAFLVDTDDYLLRRMEIEGTSTARGEPREVTFTALFEDYREVDGVVHPFRTSVSIEGMGQQMSEQEQQQLQESLRQMRSQMEQMSEEQREMMEQMMGGKMEQMEKMLASGAMDFTVQVKEIRVDEGPPGGG